MTINSVIIQNISCFLFLCNFLLFVLLNFYKKQTHVTHTHPPLTHPLQNKSPIDIFTGSGMFFQIKSLEYYYFQTRSLHYSALDIEGIYFLYFVYV